MKEIYKNWAATKGGSVDDWLKICGDNIDFGSLAQGAAPKVQYMTDYSSRDALRDYFAGLTRDWEMIEYVADEFVAQVIVSSCWVAVLGGSRRPARWYRRPTSTFG